MSPKYVLPSFVSDRAPMSGCRLCSIYQSIIQSPLASLADHRLIEVIVPQGPRPVFRVILALNS